MSDALAAGLDDAPSPRATELSAYLGHCFGPTTVAVIHYGSHAQDADARPESAHDFFVIVDRYSDAYRSLTAEVGTAYKPGVATALAHFLPPNVISVTDRSVNPPAHAKCAVLSLSDLHVACTGRAKDHFTAGRLFQYVQLTWSRDAQSREAVRAALLEARTRTFDWGRSFLPERFDAGCYFRKLLAASYSAEVRPEKGSRVAALVEARRDTVLRVYDAVLQALAARKVLIPEGKVYRQTHPPTAWDRWRTELFFKRSKVRATARWLKYVVLYEGWLDYIVEKVYRRSGVTIELTPRERRWPLIFLWPKAVRYLRSRPQRDTDRS